MTSATFVCQGICGYPGGICRDAPDVAVDTLGGQPKFIGPPMVYGGQLPLHWLASKAS